MKAYFLFLMLMIAAWSSAQEPEFEYALETEAVRAEADVEEDDADALLLESLLRSPVNLNSAGESELTALPGISPLQIKALLDHRNRYGALGSIYELQAVPGFTPDQCRRWKPYIHVGSFAESPTLKQRMVSGKHSALLRVSREWDPSRNMENFYGGAERIFLRYLYRSGRDLQWGVVGEKDAGEPFFKGASKYGFDFYSFHIFLRNYRKLKQVALGDFRVQWGQGLVLWQGSAYAEPGALTLLRQPAGLLPAQSAAEYNFMRGAALTIRLKRFEITAFLSMRKADANKVSDSLQGEYISSLIRSGYHRTEGELADKGAVMLQMAGVSVQHHNTGWQIGLNALHTQLSLPYYPRSETYNTYAFRGNKLSQAGLNYSARVKNIYLFGETAIASTGGIATVNGMLFHPARGAAVSLLYRNYGKQYAALEANAYGGTNPANESGAAIRTQLKLMQGITLLLGADWYASHYFRYRMNGIGRGREYHAEWQAQLQKKCVLSMRLLYRSQLLNHSAEEVVHAPEEKRRLSLRMNFQQSLSMQTQWSLRFEQVRSSSEFKQATWGSLFFVDVQSKLQRTIQFRGRVVFTDVDDYDARVYAYVPGVAYAGRISGFFQSALHFSLMVRKNIGKKMSLWCNLNRMQPSALQKSEDVAGRTAATIQFLYNF